MNKEQEQQIADYYSNIYSKAKEQSKQLTVAKGKKHRTHSMGKGDMAL